MSTTVPTLGKTAAQLDGLACVDCSRDDTVQQPTGDRGPTGAQLFRCADPSDCRAQSAPVFVERPLHEGVPLLYGHNDGALVVTFDPAQIRFASARELFNEARILYPAAHAVAFTTIGHIVTTVLPSGEPPARFEQHGDRCTVTFDDTRITKQQLLAFMDKAAGL